MRWPLGAPDPADNPISHARVSSAKIRREERPRHASVFHSDNLPAEIERCEREIASVFLLADSECISSCRRACAGSHPAAA